MKKFNITFHWSFSGLSYDFLGKFQEKRCTGQGCFQIHWNLIFEYSAPKSVKMKTVTKIYDFFYVFV